MGISAVKGSEAEVIEDGIEIIEIGETGEMGEGIEIIDTSFADQVSQTSDSGITFLD